MFFENVEKLITKIKAEDVEERDEKRSHMTLRSMGIRAFLCITIIILGVVVAKYLIHSAPKASRRPPAKLTPLVEAHAVYPATHRVVIQATGTVIPAQEMVLRSPR